MKGLKINPEGMKQMQSEFIGLAKTKDYEEITLSVGEAVDEFGAEFAKYFLNSQDADGKTLIHHIIENHEKRYRPGLWAVVELNMKGADLNIADKLGNTALHSCANLYSAKYSKVSLDLQLLGIVSSWSAVNAAFNDGTLASAPPKKMHADELRIYAAMQDIGALLFLGVNPNLKNQCSQTVWDIMNTTAGNLDPSVARPDINADSCKRAFLAFFNHEKPKFNATEYSWAPNVVSWAESLKLPSTTAAPRTGSSSDDDCCIPSPKVAKAADHVALLASRTAATAGGNDGCTLF